MVRPAERKFQYTRRPPENLRERANMRAGDFDSYIKSEFKTYKPKDGKNLIRIIPPTWEGAKHYGLDIHVNYGIGVDNQSYLSLAKMKGEKDPLAEARMVAERDGDPKTARALSPRKRVLIWMVDRLAEDDGPQLWAAPFTFDKDVANLCFDEDTKEILYIDDPDEGYDLRFYKEGQGMLTKYPPSKMKILAQAPLHEDPAIKKEWLDFVADHPIPDCLQYYSYDHIAATFNGHVRVDSDEEQPEKPVRRQVVEDPVPLKATRTQVQPDPEDDEPPFERPKAAEGPRPGESIRERLQRRRVAAAATDDDD